MQPSARPRFRWRVVLVASVLMGVVAVRAPEGARGAEPNVPGVAIDFTCAGYGGDGRARPNVRSVVLVRPSGGDDTALLQAAVDHVGALPTGAEGFRGVVELSPGTFRVGGQIVMGADGVVLRGSAAEGQPTTIVATGRDRRTLVEIGRAAPPTTGPSAGVTDETVAAGTRTLTVGSVEPFAVGDRVVVTRPSTAAWIKDLGMTGNAGPFADQRLDWTPGSRDLRWDRVVAGIDSPKKQVTLDAPVTTALERRYGGGTIAKVTADEPPRRIGIENLILGSESDPANPGDEEHAWIAVALHTVEDAWVSGVTARHFAGSAVRVGPRARRVTVQDCRSEQPVSEPGGYRRQSFLVEGQQVLVRRCRAEDGMNDFAVGLCAAGPNVFLDCTATRALGPSGAFESWASGVLYERVRIDGAGIRLTNDMTRSQGGGWTAANCVVSDCAATEFEVRGPAGAANVVLDPPRPLYEAQLRQRAQGADAATSPASRPSEVVAASPASGPAGTVTGSPASRPAATAVQEFRLADQHATPATTSTTPRPSPPLEIVNGRFVIGGRTLWGGQVNDGWWRGNPNPATALEAGVAITRFVPGRVGPGLTEDLPALAEKIVADGTPFYQSVPGLWYDRRRDEHSIVERTDANVWAPFYEMPWARSGSGKSWDGLSKFDLTKFNPWYFDRVREFARLCERRGLLLYHNLYNTHNLLEIGAHWADYPPRPANCVNETGLPEPPPLEPRDRLHVANQYYDADNPHLRALHRTFIFHTLDELAASPNVIFSLSAQFAGPLKFQEFFHDTVAEWEAQHPGAPPVRIALVTSKDITDAILADPKRAKQVAAIDMRYWQYMPDGTLWAPRGGQNLAFREMITKQFGKMGDAPPPTTPQQLYRQVREYRDRYPEKAIVAWHGGVGPVPVLMAGGAQTLMRNPTAGHGQGRSIDRSPVDGFVRERLAPVLMNMKPVDGGLAAGAAGNWCLADGVRQHILLFSPQGQTLTLLVDIGNGAVMDGLWCNPLTGETRPAATPTRGRAHTTILKPTDADWLLLLTRRE